MGADPTRPAVDPSGAVYGVDHLYTSTHSNIEEFRDYVRGGLAVRIHGHYEIASCSPEARIKRHLMPTIGEKPNPAQLRPVSVGNDIP